MTGSAKQSIKQQERMDCVFVSRLAPGFPIQTYIRNLAARFARVVHRLFAPEGAGNAGCPMHPQPRVRFGVGVCTRVFTAEAPETSGIPHAMVLRLIDRKS